MIVRVETVPIPDLRLPMWVVCLPYYDRETGVFYNRWLAHQKDPAHPTLLMTDSSDQRWRFGSKEKAIEVVRKLMMVGLLSRTDEVLTPFQTLQERATSMTSVE